MVRHDRRFVVVVSRGAHPFTIIKKHKHKQKCSCIGGVVPLEDSRISNLSIVTFHLLGALS